MSDFKEVFIIIALAVALGLGVVSLGWWVESCQNAAREADCAAVCESGRYWFSPGGFGADICECMP